MEGATEAGLCCDDDVDDNCMMLMLLLIVWCCRFTFAEFLYAVMGPSLCEGRVLFWFGEADSIAGAAGVGRSEHGATSALQRC
jgi:hypothetical protein